MLLIVDCRYSHTKNLDVVDKASEHNTAIVSFPPVLSIKSNSLPLVSWRPRKIIRHKRLNHGYATTLAVLLLSYYNVRVVKL